MHIAHIASYPPPLSFNFAIVCKVYNTFIISVCVRDCAPVYVLQYLKNSERNPSHLEFLADAPLEAQSLGHSTS